MKKVFSFFLFVFIFTYAEDYNTTLPSNSILNPNEQVYDVTFNQDKSYSDKFAQKIIQEVDKINVEIAKIFTFKPRVTRIEKCQYSLNQQEYCPIRLSLCDEKWNFKNGYSKEYISSFKDYKSKKKNSGVFKYMAKPVKIIMKNYNTFNNPYIYYADGEKGKVDSLYGSYKKFIFASTLWGTKIEINFNKINNSLLVKNTGKVYYPKLNVGTFFQFQGCKINLQKFQNNKWINVNKLVFNSFAKKVDIDKNNLVIYDGSLGGFSYNKTPVGRIEFIGCGNLTGYSLPFGPFQKNKTKATSFPISAIIGLPQNNSNTLLFGSQIFFFGIFGEIDFPQYGCPKGGTLKNGFCYLKRDMPECPSGYKPYNSNLCVKIIKYKYYDYLCSGKNEYNQLYQPINKGGDCHPSNINDLIDTNGDGIPDSCNSPTPPPNNCRAKTYACPFNVHKKCVYVNNQWQCSPYECNSDHKCGIAYCADENANTNNDNWVNRAIYFSNFKALYYTECKDKICDLTKYYISSCGESTCPKGFNVFEQNGKCYKKECPPGTTEDDDGKCIKKTCPDGYKPYEGDICIKK